jgi:hypothetical protein
MFHGVTAEDNKEQRLRELDELVEIRNASRKCERKLAGEAAWNCDVHSRVLRLALKSHIDVEQNNVYGR